MLGSAAPASGSSSELISPGVPPVSEIEAVQLLIPPQVLLTSMSSRVKPPPALSSSLYQSSEYATESISELSTYLRDI